MPSPFPGMDPYLESLDWFPDLHDSLITFVKGTLQQRLPEFYYAQSSQRVWLEYSQRYVEPDLEVVRSGQEARRRGSGGIAVAQPLFRPSPWSSRSRRSNTDRSRSRSWRSVGAKARMFAWSRPSRSSACPTRAQATRDARSTCRSSARSSRASPTWSKSTCFAAAFTRRLSRERWPWP